MENRQIGRPTIPTSITVHLGDVNNPSKNVTVSFTDYIKNVACSEIFPSWPEVSIRCNVLAIISFTLNRIYTEWYRSKGYDFDITSLPNYDQTFIYGRDLFENITMIVDELFNNYIVKGNHIEPFFAKYCDGKKTLCDGLSQWGTVSLANQGKTPLEILKHYYGEDISIIRDAKLTDVVTSYPGVPLKLGDVLDHVKIIKRELNRIAINYPALPKFEVIHEYYDVLLEDAIKKFQDIFDLEVTGIIDKPTWYKIKYIYSGVKKLSDMYTEGITLEDIETDYNMELKLGDVGNHIRALHYFLGVIAYFDDNIPLLEIDSKFDSNTKQMVISFQNEYNIKATGVVDINTWNKIKEVYLNVLSTLPSEYLIYKDEIYPGTVLSLGMMGDDVTTLQQFLSDINKKNPNFPKVNITGCYDTKTEEAIKYIQSENNLEENGTLGPIEWKYMIEMSKK